MGLCNILPVLRIPGTAWNVVPNPALVRHECHTVLLGVTHKVVRVARNPVCKCYRITYKKKYFRYHKFKINSKIILYSQNGKFDSPMSSPNTVSCVTQGWSSHIPPLFGISATQSSSSWLTYLITRVAGNPHVTGSPKIHTVKSFIYVGTKYRGLTRMACLWTLELIDS